MRTPDGWKLKEPKREGFAQSQAAVPQVAPLSR